MSINKFSISNSLNKDKIFLLNKNEIEKRLDPQFYKKEFKDNLAKIVKSPYKRLGDIVKFSNETWNQTNYFASTFPYIEISEIDTVSGEILNIHEVEKDKAPSRAKMIVRENDILISTTRPNRGAISLIKKENDFSIASTGFSVIREILDPKIHREFLFSILRQKFLLMQFEQRSSGGNYPAITQEELSNTIIPIPNEKIQNKVASIFENCFIKKKQNDTEAEKLLASIDDYLLKELGITLPPVQENSLKNRIFKTTLKETSGGRLDPFYHQNNFNTNIEAILKGKYPVKQLSDVVKDKLVKGKLPTLQEKDGNNLVVQINGITLDGDIKLCELLTAKDIFKEEQILEKGDILVVITGATIGKISYWDYEGKYFLGGDIVKFQTNQLAHSLYVYNLLRSTPIQIEIKRKITGATNGHLSPDELKYLPIPLPPTSKQIEIAEHITEIRNKAKKLKEETKAEMEKAGKQIERILFS